MVPSGLEILFLRANPEIIHWNENDGENSEGEEGGFVKRFCDLPGVITNELCVVSQSYSWDDTFLSSSGFIHRPGN